jgi:hypothetical protein
VAARDGGARDSRAAKVLAGWLVAPVGLQTRHDGNEMRKAM